MLMGSLNLGKSLCEEKKKYRKKILHELCSEVWYAAETSKKKKKNMFVNKMIHLDVK